MNMSVSINVGHWVFKSGKYTFPPFYLVKENCCTMATSEQNMFRPQQKSEFGIAQQFSFRSRYPKTALT
jgi:hypothetical protein